MKEVDAMEDFFQQFMAAVGFRTSGPMNLRFIIQPLIALVFSVLDGVRDAKAGRHLYLLSLIREPANRKKYALEGWRSIGKVFIIAVILDFIFQVLFMGQLNLVGSLLAGLILAVFPYMLLRGPVNFIAGRIINRHKKKDTV